MLIKKKNNVLTFKGSYFLDYLCPTMQTMSLSSRVRQKFIFLREFYSVRSLFCEKFIPWEVYSVRSLFREKFIPWEVHSVRSLFREKFIPWEVYSVRSLFCEKFILWEVYSARSLFCEKFILWKFFISLFYPSASK